VHARIKLALTLLLLIPLTTAPTLALSAQPTSPEPLWIVVEMLDDWTGVREAEWSPDGAQLAVAQDTSFTVYTADGDPHWSETLGDPVMDLAWSPDSRVIAVAVDNVVILYDRWGTQLAFWHWPDYPGYPPRVYDIDWAPDSKSLAWIGVPTLAVATYDFDSIIRDAYTNERFTSLAPEPVSVWSWDRDDVWLLGVDWGPSDMILAYGYVSMDTRWGWYKNATIMVFNPDGTQAWNTTIPEAASVDRASWNPATGQIAVDLDYHGTVGQGNARVIIYSPDGTLQWETMAGGDDVAHYWSPDGTKLLVLRINTTAYTPKTQIEVYDNNGALLGVWGPTDGSFDLLYRIDEPSQVWSPTSSLIAIPFTPVNTTSPDTPYIYDVLPPILIILDANANPLWQGPLVTNETMPGDMEVLARATYSTTTAWHPQVDAIAIALVTEAAKNPTAPWEPTLIVELLTLTDQPITAQVPPQPQYQPTTTTTTTETPQTTTEATNTPTTTTTTGGTADAETGDEGGDGLPVSTTIIAIVVIIIVVVGVAKKFVKIF